MSVYTSVSTDQLKAFLSNYHVGDLKAFRGIAEGVENTNYRVSCTAGEYILTLFEHFTHEQ
ncbi:MAG: homoserine kinase, partial [Gammaproteobacteria bacterium]|nr:homoserine kinase [Gammaproteobacteria bacterium]